MASSRAVAASLSPAVNLRRIIASFPLALIAGIIAAVHPAQASRATSATSAAFAFAAAPRIPTELVPSPPRAGLTTRAPASLGRPSYRATAVLAKRKGGDGSGEIDLRKELEAYLKVREERGADNAAQK